ncbi:MAG: hypothetical protein FWG37_00885 [Clostridia bacterium]|nr:hypothetical protein [Clostridia bacterium]
MRLWMYGAGDQPEKNIKTLKSLGFSTVVGGGPETMEAAAANGLDFYHCSGAFGYRDEFQKDEYLSVDINGDRRLWFGSTCPTNEKVRAKNIGDIQTIVRRPGAKGVLIDGARFASPASADNPEAFFTCFCEGCMKKAADMGLDTLRMQKAVYALYSLCFREGDATTFVDQHLIGLMDWFAFRRRATTEHIVNYARAVKSVREELIAGIYIFTPSLSAVVGQSYRELRSVLDLFSPMIYRHYRLPEGPACLNIEFEAIVSALNSIYRDSARTEAFLYALTGLRVPPNPAAQGLPVEAVYTEAKTAAALAGPKQTVPIILLDDDRLKDSIDACQNAGADAVALFAWNEKHMEAASAGGALPSG